MRPKRVTDMSVACRPIVGPRQNSHPSWHGAAAPFWALGARIAGRARDVSHVIRTRAGRTPDVSGTRVERIQDVSGTRVERVRVADRMRPGRDAHGTSAGHGAHRPALTWAVKRVGDER